MKAIMKFTRQANKGITILVGMLCAFIVCGCQDENDMPTTPLTDIDWNDVDGSILLNDVYLKDATAQFIAVSGSDSATIVLSGVHPTEKIEMEVATTRDGEGGITFVGEQTIENLRQLKVAGRYRPYGGTSGYSSMIRIGVSYSVPNKISSSEFVIPFNENSGFRYHYDSCWNPSREEIDSCEFIIGRINPELGRHLKNLSFKFGNDGNLTFSCTNSKSVVTKQTFRYWIDEKELPQRIVVNIENSELFYDFLLNSLTPDGNRIVGNILKFDTDSEARIHIVEKDNQIDGIVILDDLHYKIFPYLYITLPTDKVWSDKEKDCFEAMERVARHSERLNSTNLWYSFGWAFGNGSN